MFSHFQEILEDEMKFKLADINKDNALDFPEYAAFHNPEMEDYKHMHPFLVDDDMKDYDKNKDGKLNFEEFQLFEAGNVTYCEFNRCQKVAGEVEEVNFLY